MRPQRRRRREGGQAVFEMAIVLPIMLSMTLGFIALSLQVHTRSEFDAALHLAAEATLQAPRGDAVTSEAYAQYTFDHTLNATGSTNGYLTIVSPLNCTGDYMSGIESNNPVTCTASVDLHYDNSPVGLVWRSTVHISGQSTAQPPPFRRCANPVPNQTGPNC